MTETDLWPEPSPFGDGSDEGETEANDGTPGAVGSEEALRAAYKRSLPTDAARVLLGQVRAVVGHEESKVAALPAPLRKATLALVGLTSAEWPSYPSPNYSSRKGAKIRLAVYHTAEGARTRASLGAFFARAATGASSHTGIDDTGITRYVPDVYSAWTARNANPVSVQTELCGFAAWSASEWGRHAGMLENAAKWAVQVHKDHGIPLVRLTPAQSVKGTGFCMHRDITVGWKIGSHTDCGTSFPIDAVLARARQIVAGNTDDFEELLKMDVDNPYANGGKGGRESADVTLGYMEQRIREGIKAELPGLVADAVKDALRDFFAQLPAQSADELLNRKLPTPTFKNGTVVPEDTRVAEILPRAAEASVTRHLDGASS